MLRKKILKGKCLDGLCSPSDAEQLLAELESPAAAEALFLRHVYHERTVMDCLAPVHSDVLEFMAESEARETRGRLRFRR